MTLSLPETSVRRPERSGARTARAADPSPGADGPRAGTGTAERGVRATTASGRDTLAAPAGPRSSASKGRNASSMIGRQRLVACRNEVIERRRQRRSEVMLCQREAARADGRKAAVHRERHETGRVILAHRGGEQMNVVQPDEGRRIEVVRHTMEARHQERVRRGKSLGAASSAGIGRVSAARRSHGRSRENATRFDTRQ